jgi:hypothetical protein
MQGAEWITELYNGDLCHIEFKNKFIRDSLCCEYGYIINLDTMMFEFYVGFQKNKQLNNPFNEIGDNGYYPSKLVSIMSLRDVDLEKLDILKKSAEDGYDEGSEVRRYLTNNRNIIRKLKLESLE